MPGAEAFTVLAVLRAQDQASEFITTVSENLKRLGVTATDSAGEVKAAGAEIDESLAQSAGASGAAREAAGGYDAEAEAARAAAAENRQVAESSTAAAAGGHEVAAGMDEAAAAAGTYYDAAGRARLANGQFASSADLAAAGADKVAAAQERAGIAAGESGGIQEAAAAKSATASEKSAGAMAGMSGAAEKSKLALLGVAGGLAYGVYKAAGFQQSMLLLHTQAGVTTGVMNQMGTGVLKLAGQVGQGPDSLAEAAYHVASNMSSMGATSTQMLSAVKVAAEGASVGNANLVDVTNALGAAIASGMKGTQNYTQAMAVMNSTVGAGDMNMQQLSQAFGGGNLATVKGYGATLTDTGAILATFGDNLLRGSAAGTEMRMSVQALAVQASTAKPALAELGLSAGQIGANMQAHGVVSTLNMLNDRMKAAGLTAATEGPVITELFGKKAGAGISILLEQIGKVNSKMPQLAKGAKDFNAAWAAQQASPAQKLKDLETGSQALAVTLGTALLPAATRVVSALSGFVNWLEKGSLGARSAAVAVGAVLGLIALKKLEDGLKGAVEGVSGLVKGFKATVSGAQAVISKLGALTSAQGKAAAASESAAATEEAAAGEAAAAQEEAATESSAGWIASAASTVAAWAATSARMVGQGIAWVASNTARVATVVAENVGGALATAGAWIAANALMTGGIVLVVAAVAVAVVEIVKHWSQIVAGVEKAWNAVYSFISGVISDVIGFLKSHWPLILAIITGPMGLAVYAIVKYWDDIRKWFSDGVSKVESVLHWFDSLPGKFRSWLGGAASAVTSEGARVLSWFESLPGRVLAEVERIPAMLFGSGEHIIESLASGIMHAAGGALHSAMSFVANTVKSFLPFSPAKQGPLSGSGDPGNSGRSIAGNLAKGITAGTPQAAQAAMAMAARVQAATSSMTARSGSAGIGSPLALSAVSPAGGAASSGGIVVNLTINEPHMMTEADMSAFMNRMGPALNRALGQAGVKIRMG